MAVTVLSNNATDVGEIVAVNVADEITVVSGNCSVPGCIEPGLMSPTEIVCGFPAMVRVNVPTVNTAGVSTGKSGGRAKPPVPGSPVKLLIVKTSTPGNPGAEGMSSSYDKSPT